MYVQYFMEINCSIRLAFPLASNDPCLQCGCIICKQFVAPIVFDGSPDSVSPHVVWVLMVLQVVGLVVSFAVRRWWLYCGAIIGDHCGWPLCLGQGQHHVSPQ